MHFHRLVVAAALCLLVTGVAQAAEYTRDGGTADWMCCQDKACATVISQHADPVRAEKACSKLTDADGKTRYTRSNAFRITATVTAAGTATLSWTPPTRNIDGSALTNLAGYRISYGTSSTALTQTIQVAVPGATAYTISNLAPGTWYLSVRAYTSNGTESDQSAVRNKVIM